MGNDKYHLTTETKNSEVKIDDYSFPVYYVPLFENLKFRNLIKGDIPQFIMDSVC
jgi:hypothetical protein